MNNKLKAATFVALYTVSIIVLVGAIQIILTYLNPTLEQLGVAFAILMLAYAMKMMYDLRLNQLETRDRLNELNSK